MLEASVCSFFNYYSKGVMFLHKVAEDDYDRSGNNLGDNGVNVNIFHKKFEQDIVQQQANDVKQEVANQLNSALNIRLAKNYIFHQKEPNAKIHDK